MCVQKIIMCENHAIVLLKYTPFHLQKAKIPLTKTDSSIFLKGDQHRGATLIHGDCRALYGYWHTPTVNACHTLRNTRRFAFVSHPQRSICRSVSNPTSSNAGSLCGLEGLYLRLNGLMYSSITHPSRLVNSFWNFYPFAPATTAGVLGLLCWNITQL